MERIVKESFCVIGKQGSTNDGPGFVKRLWQEANRHFDEIKDLALYQDNGKLVGMWGAMTSFDCLFHPWEDGFSKGLYLAGVEVKKDTVPPDGWEKWIIPGFVYLKKEVTGTNTLEEVLTYMDEEQIPLVGAIQDFTDPETGIDYMMFPIERLD